MGIVTILTGVILLVATAFIAEENEPLIIAAAAGLLLFISAGIIFGAISAVADQVTKD